MTWMRLVEEEPPPLRMPADVAPRTWKKVPEPRESISPERPPTPQPSLPDGAVSPPEAAGPAPVHPDAEVPPADVVADPNPPIPESSPPPGSQSETNGA